MRFGVVLARTPAHSFAIALLAALACNRPAPAQTPVTSPARDNQPQDEAVTLDTLRVTAQRPPTAREQLHGHLQRNWHPPRSAEQFGLDGGVPAWLGQQVVRGMTAAARSLPGWKQQVRPAIARPPPLDEAQMDRSQALQTVSPSPDAPPR